MKKIILSICFLLATASMVSAQRAAERKAEITKGLKEQVKLTDSQVQSVMDIETEFKTKSRAIRTDSTLTDVDKKAKQKALNDEKRNKMESTLGKETTQKVEDFYTELKKESKALKTKASEKN